MGVLFTMRTSEGTLTVEISEPDATVQVLDADGKLLIEQKPGAEKVEISVVPGKGKLHIRKNGFELFAKEFALVSGGRETVIAKLIPQRQEGTLVVNISEPDATIQVFGADGKVVIEQKAGAEKVEISVVPGKGKLHVVKKGFEPLHRGILLGPRRARNGNRQADSTAPRGTADNADPTFPGW